MSPLRSLTTLLLLVSHSLAMPVADDDDYDDGCWFDSRPVTTPVHQPVLSPPVIFTPHTYLPAPRPSPVQHPHATLPVSHPPDTTSAVLGTMSGILIALVGLGFLTRYVIRRRRAADPFEDPPKPRFTAFRFWPRSAAAKRLSDESWVSPTLPADADGSPELRLSEYLELRRRLVPVTTPVCTPTESEFGLDEPIPVPPVRVPSPVYISPFSPSPSLSSSPSLSPAPSTEPLPSPSPSTARLSRLLSSTFRDIRLIDPPARPTTAHLIQTARSYADAYRTSSTTTNSLYVPPTGTSRLAGTRSRTNFYPGPNDDTHAAWERIRDTFSTVTTADTIYTVPHLHAAAERQPSTSPFADPDPSAGDQHLVTSPSDLAQSHEQARAPVGTSLGLKLRLSDASEHAHYRLRERERERKRQLERERPDAATRPPSWEVRKEFKLRDSESVLREIGW